MKTRTHKITTILLALYKAMLFALDNSVHALAESGFSLEKYKPDELEGTINGGTLSAGMPALYQRYGLGAAAGCGITAVANKRKKKDA